MQKFFWASSNFSKKKNIFRLHKLLVLFGTLLLLQVNWRSFFCYYSGWIDFLHSLSSTIHLILRLTLVFMWNNTQPKKFKSFKFFKSFLLVLTKFLFWHKYWPLGYHCIKFQHFSDISKLPKILSLKSLGNSWSKSYILYL